MWADIITTAVSLFGLFVLRVQRRPRTLRIRNCRSGIGPQCPDPPRGVPEISLLGRKSSMTRMTSENGVVHRAKEQRSTGGHRAKESPSKGAKEVTEQRRSPNKGVTEQRSKKKTKEQAKEQKLGEKERGNIKFLFRALSSCPGKRVQTSKNVCRRETDELLFSRVLFICFVLHPFQNDLCLFDHKLLLPLKEERHFGRNHVCVCEYY